MHATIEIGAKFCKKIHIVDIGNSIQNVENKIKKKKSCQKL